jgi:hypothetical protein
MRIDILKTHHNGEKTGDFAIMMSLSLLDYITQVFDSKETLETARLFNEAFTRDRNMPFTKALYFMLDMRTTTLQTRLNAFFNHNGGGEPISQQAFSKLRANFDHSPFKTTVRGLVKEEYSGKHPLTMWNGYHLLGVDGSYMQLPRVESLRLEFGVRGGGACPMAGISVLFDVLHGWALDPILSDAYMNEREQLKQHMDFLHQELPDVAKKTILLLDRGYPSKDLFKKMTEQSFMFVARCKSNFDKAVDCAPIGDSVVSIKNGIVVRIVKFELENGNIETIATNLFNLPMETIIELYAMRWGIETMYFKLKQELCVEKFSGKTANSIRQDFWASMVLLNSVAVFQHEADCAVRERQENKSLKHDNRARTSDLIITLRDRFIFAALCGHPMLTAWEMDDVIKTMARVVSPVRPGRSFPRNFKPLYNVNHNLKSHL